MHLGGMIADDIVVGSEYNLQMSLRRRVDDTNPSVVNESTDQ